MENCYLEDGFASQRVWHLTPPANCSVDPQFEMREEQLVLAAKSTCFIGVKPGLDDDGKPTPSASGTAFFVGPTILVTAGHLVPDGKRKIVAQHPGTGLRPSILKIILTILSVMDYKYFHASSLGQGVRTQTSQSCRSLDHTEPRIICKFVILTRIPRNGRAWMWSATQGCILHDMCVT